MERLILQSSLTKLEHNVSTHNIKPQNVFVVTRSDTAKPSCEKYGYNYVNELAPSWKLYNKVKTYKKLNHWDKHSFDNFYAPLYNRELISIEKIPFIKRIYDLIKSGEKVLLVCFCQNEEMCHTSLLKEIILLYAKAQK